MCFRNSLTFIALTLIVISPVHGEYATQSDWSDDSGVYGPVTQWEDDYLTSSGFDKSDKLVLSLTTEEHLVDDDCNGESSVFSVDIDDDGDMDILGTSEDDNDLIWWENANGTGTSWIKHVIDTSYYGARAVHSADMNSDGRKDIISVAEYAYDVTWWENTDSGSGIVWIEHIVDPDYLRPETVLAVDINGDGDMDVLSCSCDSLNHITWWENMDGLGTSWTEHTVYQGSYLGVCSVFSQDIDGDGDMDVVGCEVWDMYAGYIRWFENENGVGTSWNIHTVYSKAGGNPWSVHSEDMDDDGDMDILASLSLYYDVTDVSWWENVDGAGGSWTQHIVSNSFNGAQDVHAEDMDDDGDMDMIGAAYGSGFSWFENLSGSGTSWVEHSIDDDGVDSESVYAEDIDGDGEMDLIGSREYADNWVKWWAITGFQTDGLLESTILDTECSPQWASIDWNGTEQSGTELYIQYRTSDSPGSMGIWSDPVYYPRFLSGLLDRYFQYRIVMESGNPQNTPILEDITLNWDPNGIEGDPETFEFTLLGAAPNPAESSVSIHFGIPEQLQVSISIFDLSGRIIHNTTDIDYIEGYHSLMIDDLPPGVYFCRMEAGDFTATERFVILR